MSTRGRGRPRKADADRQILDAASTLLRRVGYRAFSVDVIAESTGIAKTTIYRRWPSKGALVAAAIAPLHAESNDATAILEETAEVVRLLADAEGDALDALRAALAPRLERLRTILGEDAADAQVGAMLIRAVLS